MSDEKFLIEYENLLDKDYCNCNEMNCIDNNSPRRILNIAKSLQKENQKLKEVIDKIRKHCEIEINASNHYLKNHSSQKELCHKVAHQRILDILKEVE